QSFQLRELECLFTNLHLLVQTALFRHVADAANIVYGIKLLSFENNFSFVGVEDAGDHADESGLAGPVGTKQTEYLPFIETKRDIIHRLLCGKILPQLSQFKYRHAKQFVLANIMVMPV